MTLRLTEIKKKRGDLSGVSGPSVYGELVVGKKNIILIILVIRNKVK